VTPPTPEVSDRARNLEPTGVRIWEGGVMSEALTREAEEGTG